MRLPVLQPTPSFALNPSGANRFMSCETKWALHTLLGVDKRRGPDSDARDRGKAMHRFVEEYVRDYARTGDLAPFEGIAGENKAREIFEQLEDEEDVQLEEQLAHDILAAARYVLPLLGLEKFEVVQFSGAPAVELDVRATVDGLEYQAIVDAVLRHKSTGEIWVVDWKTTEAAIDTSKTPNATWHDYQLALQRFVLRHAYGIAVDRSALVQVRSKAPQPPPVTSRGKVTRDLKKLSCDAQTYLAALVENGEDASDPKTLEKLRALEDCVYVRWLPDVTSKAGQRELEAQLQSMRRTQQEIAEGKRVPRMNLRNASGHAPYNGGCRRCDYEGWCREYLRTGEIDFSLVGVEYVRNDKATFDASSERRGVVPASDAYVEFTREYGEELHALQPFTP